MLDKEDYQFKKKNKFDDYVIQKVVVDEHIVEIIQDEEEVEENENISDPV